MHHRGHVMSDETPERKNFAIPNGCGSMSYGKGIDAGLLLPGQYVDLVRRNEVIEGELKLLLAVLEDAIRCYLRNVNAKDRRAPPRLRRGQELVRSRRRCGRRQARGYLQLRQSLRRAWHRATLPACAPADSDNQRSAVAALPDAPPSPAVEPATCKRRALARPGPLPRLVTQGCLRRTSIPVKLPGVAVSATISPD